MSSSEIVEENNYYPFGLKYKGYNENVTSSNPALKRKYNGIELEDALGLDLYEMDMRQYDPAIARWTSIDPVTHFEYSTYSAFDNNPVFWADPSGADSESDIFGRNKHDENGIYIPPNERGDIDYSYSNSQSAGGNQDNSTNFQININNDQTLYETHIKLEGKLIFNLLKTGSNKMLPDHLLKLEGAVKEVLFSAALLWSSQSGFVLNINGNVDSIEMEVGISMAEIFKLSNATKIQGGRISNETSFSEGLFKIDFTGGGKLALIKNGLFLLDNLKLPDLFLLRI